MDDLGDTAAQTGAMRRSYCFAALVCQEETDDSVSEEGSLPDPDADYLNTSRDEELKIFICTDVSK